MIVEDEIQKKKIKKIIAVVEIKKIKFNLE